jgi:hypothetical protein
MPATYAASAGPATPQSAIARALDRQHGSLHIADSARVISSIDTPGDWPQITQFCARSTCRRWPLARLRITRKPVPGGEPRHCGPRAGLLLSGICRPAGSRTGLTLSAGGRPPMASTPLRCASSSPRCSALTPSAPSRTCRRIKLSHLGSVSGQQSSKRRLCKCTFGSSANDREGRALRQRSHPAMFFLWPDLTRNHGFGWGASR